MLQQDPCAQRYDAGCRKLTPNTLEVQDLAARWQGLPDSLAKGHVIGITKRAMAYLGLSGTPREMLDLLYSYSQPQDWESDSRPIVWPSNDELSHKLGLSLSQVKRTLRGLIEARLIAPVDGPDGHRRGARQDGRILYAYGFDLSPMAQRYHELCAIVEQGDADRQRRVQLRSRLTIARKAIYQIATTALEFDVLGCDWGALVETARALAADARSINDLGALELAVVDLEHRRTEAESVLKATLEPVDENIKMTPAGSFDGPSIQTTTEPSADKSATCKSKARQTKPGAPSRKVQTKSKPSGLVDCDSFRIGPSMVLEIAPLLESYVFSNTPTWPEIHDAAASAAAHLGISPHAWGDACQVLGRTQAALAVTLIIVKREQIQSPGGYLRAMTRRAETGELHLGRSFFGLVGQRSSLQ